MNIKGAIFDCDGTLVGSLGFWEAFYTKAGEHFFGDPDFKVDPADDRAMRTQSVYYLSELMHNKYGMGESVEALCVWTSDLLGWYYDEVVELKKGVRELLAYLKSRNVRMCIASASEADAIRRVLGRHHVLHYFEDIISCTKVGAGKDKPDVFFAAEKFLGTKRNETWVFEDSVLAIETAKSAGFPVVGVYDACTFGQEQAQALSDAYVAKGGSFAELIDMFE
jgi:HAD superfamily hydrolase (TIGR01509 family)